MVVIQWIGSVLYTLSFAFLIIGNVIRFYFWIKHKKYYNKNCKEQEYKIYLNPCRSTKCPYRNYCYVWMETLTKEEKQYLLQVIEQLKEKIPKDNFSAGDGSYEREPAHISAD